MEVFLACQIVNLKSTNFNKIYSEKRTQVNFVGVKKSDLRREKEREKLQVFFYEKQISPKKLEIESYKFDLNVNDQILLPWFKV